MLQEMWQAKARALNIPLSAKGHEVGQRGAITSLAIDTHKGVSTCCRTSLPPWSQQGTAAELSTPRIIARAFACHISCSIPRTPRIRPRSRRSRHAHCSGVDIIQIRSSWPVHVAPRAEARAWVGIGSWRTWRRGGGPWGRARARPAEWAAGRQRRGSVVRRALGSLGHVWLETRGWLTGTLVARWRNGC